MTEAEWRAFVSAGTRTGKLATVTRAGSPTVNPVWFVLDGDDLVFTTWHESAKAGHLRRDPRVAVCVEDDAFPYGYVLVRGTVRWDEADPQLAEFARRIAARYVPEDVLDATARRNGLPGEWLCRLRAERVVGHTGIAS